MTEEKKVIASFLVNFRKAKKVVDPMEYAEYCKKLLGMYESPEEVAAKLGVGRETVRILAKLTELPSEVKHLISKRRLPLTVAFDIVPLDRSKQIEAAKAVTGLPYRDARKVIRRISENPHKSAESIRIEVLSELEKKEVNIAMIALPRYVFESLQKESKDVPIFIKDIVEDWLAKGYTLDYPYSFNKENLVSLVVRLPRATFMALRRKTRKPANLIEQIVITWLKRKAKLSDR